MESKDILDGVKNCPDCKGIGKRLDGKRVINCHCVETALFDYRLSVSNIPPRLRKFEFRDIIYKNSPTFKKIQKYITDVKPAMEKGIGLYFYGSDSDSNMFAIGVLKELMRVGYMCYYTPYASCLSKVGSEPEPSILSDRYSFVCLGNITTVLDNLTNFKQTILTEAPTNFAVSYLEQILSSRASMNLPVFITGSVGPEKLIEKFPSLGTVIYGNLLAVECVEDDFRGKRAYAKLEHEFGFDQIKD